MRKSRNLRSVALASVSLIGLSGVAFAQDTAANGAETVVVTGSRVIQDVANSPTPVTIVSTQQLLTTTPTDIPDGLNKLPVFQNSNSSANRSSGGGNSSGDFLNLRNFGPQRTLVLLDGMRLPASNQGGSVDTSTLPQTLISRVDVVTAGASAVYGSDAVTGVVNFILDKNFNGFKYEANSGVSMYGDGAKFKVSAAAGTDIFGGRGHIEGAIEYRRSDGVLNVARPSGAEYLGAFNTGAAPQNPITNITQSGQLVSTTGGKITCSNCTVNGVNINGYEFVSPGVVGPINYGTIPQTPGATVPNTLTASNCPDCAKVAFVSLYGDTKNASLFERFSYNINSDTVFFSQLSLTQASVFNYFFPSQQEPSRQTQYYYKNNAFLPAATRVALGDDSVPGTANYDPNWATDGSNVFQVSEWYADPNRTRKTNNVTRSINFSNGASGVMFNDYIWEAHYTHGETRASTTGLFNGNNQYHDAAQDAVIDPATNSIVCYADTPAAGAATNAAYAGCIPINVFGTNVTTNAQYNYWSRSTHFAETNTIDDIAGDVSGSLFNLPAGPVRVAVAGEMRWLDYTINSNASPTAVVNCAGLRLCGNTGKGTGPVNQATVTQTLWDNNTVPSVHASENVWEFSGEIGIPILKDMPFVQSLDADVAGRYTDYSISGAVETWKIGLDYHVNDSVRFRGTTSIDIRAPTLNDLYSPQTSNSGPFSDPLTNFNPGGIQTVSGGNPKLVPEVARTYTGGVVLTPTFIPGLTMSADYYQINLHNAITNISGTNLAIANLCIASGGTSPFCSLYVRPFPYTNTTPANYPTLIYSQSLNAAFNKTEGEDYEVDYGFNMADVMSDMAGSVNLRALLNVAPVNTTSNFPGAPLTHTTQPKGHATLFGGYSLGNWSVDAQWHWFSDLHKNGIIPPCTVNTTGAAAGYCSGITFYAVNRVPGFSTTDFTITKKITFDNGSVMSAYFNVQNAFNSIPPDVTGSSSNPGGPSTPAGEDLMGRYFTIGLRGNL